ncbi:hypothetical protein [Nonomuraea rhodomycinica]|uniref:Uncharacterized protein n=1 Tax=Nonomuraea rhodomycinica TaxID=1712872 RepID=A0A7Y6IYC7_9ACTN|nr:hypothetical protein [Nonomuraea rhodomycinica]NUW46676.1 hypothetical protein [Nonomuraea rhodomycinica]
MGDDVREYLPPSAASCRRSSPTEQGLAGGSPGAVLGAYRTALVVPVAMVLLGAAVSAFGLRAGRRDDPVPAAHDEVSDGLPPWSSSGRGGTRS